MSTLKRLAGQTAIYGMSSILGRVLNFLLVPLHTHVLSQSEYGQNTHLYSIIAFLIVIYTYGFETSFFKFSESEKERRSLVFSTAQWSILITTIAFTLLIAAFFTPLVEVLRYGDHPSFVAMMFAILATDALAAIPFAKLRSENRAIRFVVVKMTLIVINILLNLWFYWLWPLLIQKFGFLEQWYDPNFGIGYLILANLIASSVMLLMLLPEFTSLKTGFDSALWKKMFKYGLPLMVAGLAGVANEMLDRQMIRYLLPESIAEAQLGIYGAVYKISIFLVLFNQAFRYAAEPFFFSQESDKDSKKTFANVMDWFVLVLGIGFTLVLAFLPYLKHFIDEKFWEGLFILPILLAANVFLGINTNLSVWYKLSGKTYFGMIITYVGLVFTIVGNLYLVPKLGYEGAAWATFFSYLAMMLTSYFTGRNRYPIPYHLGKISLVLLFSFAAGYLAWLWSAKNFLPQLGVLMIYFTLISLLFKREFIQLWQSISRK